MEEILRSRSCPQDLESCLEDYGTLKSGYKSLNKRFEQEKRRNKEKRKEWRRAWQQQAADVADKLHEHIGNLSNAHMLRKRAAKPAETLVAITRTTKKNYRTHQKTRINKDGEEYTFESWSPRYTAKAQLLQAHLRVAAGGMSGKRIATCLDTITRHIANDEFYLDWASENTVRKTETLFDCIEIVLQRQLIQQATSISLGFDLSPQGGMELLATSAVLTFDKLTEVNIVGGGKCKLFQGDYTQHLRLALPLVQTGSKKPAICAKQLSRVLDLMHIEPIKVRTCVADEGSENAGILLALFPHATMIPCSAHKLVNCFKYALEPLPKGSSALMKKKTLMDHDFLAAVSHVINQIHRNWQNFSVAYLAETGEHLQAYTGRLTKPTKHVVTRWTSIISSVSWLLPKIPMVLKVVSKYFLVDLSKGKAVKNWQKVLAYIQDDTFLVCNHIVNGLGEFFMGAMKWIETDGQLQRMKREVETWTSELMALQADKRVTFASAYNVNGRSKVTYDDDEVDRLISQTVIALISQLQERFAIYSQGSLVAVPNSKTKRLDVTLALVGILCPGRGRRHALQLVQEFGNEGPKGMDKQLECIWADVVQISQGKRTLHQCIDTISQLEVICNGGMENVEPERYFSIIRQRLLRAPHSSLHALSAHLRFIKNEFNITPALIEEHSKEARGVMNTLVEKRCILVRHFSVADNCK